MLLYNCKSILKPQPEVSIEILNKNFRKSDSIVKIKIINRSHQNYFFPIDTTSLAPLCEAMINSPSKNDFFHLRPIITTNTSDTLPRYVETTMLHISRFIDSLEKNCKSEIQHRIILVEARSEKIIPVYFYLNKQIDSFESFGFQNYDKIGKEKAYLSFIYPAKHKLNITQYLSVETLDSLHRKGYSLYNFELDTKKIPVLK